MFVGNRSTRMLTVTADIAHVDGEGQGGSYPAPRAEWAASTTRANQLVVPVDEKAREEGSLDGSGFHPIETRREDDGLVSTWFGGFGRLRAPKGANVIVTVRSD
jgi:hypothetical protein